MAWAPGEAITADRLNLRTSGVRIATTIVTTDGASSDAETIGMTVVAPLVSGRTYRIRAIAKIEGGAVDQRVVCRIKEDGLAGAGIQTENLVLLHTSGTAGNPITMEGEYTAVATGNKTFVFTYDNASAAAVNQAALSTAPGYLYVDYISG